jgi:HEAT repeat protein
MALVIDDKPWFVQRELAKVLGKIGSGAAVPPLQALLRRTDLRVLQTAVTSLSSISDPAAERALHMVLKASAGDARAAVIGSLVGLKDARVGPMLARILQDSDPFGDDSPMILETLTALATIRDDRALPQIAALARKKQWLAWGRTTQMRQACLETLGRIGTPKAKQTMAELASSGDFFLKRMARKAAG